MTDKKPAELATIADLDDVRDTLRKEVDDIRGAYGMLRDDDPANDGVALLEIGESLGKIAMSIVGVAAGTLYVLQSLGIM